MKSGTGGGFSQRAEGSLWLGMQKLLLTPGYYHAPNSTLKEHPAVTPQNSHRCTGREQKCKSQLYAMAVGVELQDPRWERHAPELRPGRSTNDW